MHTHTIHAPVKLLVLAILFLVPQPTAGQELPNLPGDPTPSVAEQGLPGDPASEATEQEATEQPDETDTSTNQSAPTQRDETAVTSSAPGDDGTRPLPTIEEVTDHIDRLYRSRSSRSSMTMSVATANYSRTIEMQSWTLGEDLALIVIRSPAREAGTATLKTNEGLWNYAPRADRLMRIPSGLLSDSWMGSHFTNDDLMRESSYLEDFDAQVSWTEEEGTTYLKLDLTPHPEAPIVYTHVIYILTADRWIPVRSEFFDGDDLVRTFHFSNILEVAGRPIPMLMQVIPHDRPGEYTHVEYTRHEIDIDINPELFTRQRLRSCAQRAQCD